MKPSTTVLASSARSDIRASNAGSRKEAGAAGTSERGARRGSCGDELSDQCLGGDRLRLRKKIEQDAMAEDGQGERAHIVERDVGAPLEQRARLGAEDQRLRSADAGAVRHPLLDEARRRGVGGAAETHQP